MINLEKLQIKLDAVLAKDIDAIYAAKIYLPFLGNSYNKNQLRNWLKKSSYFLKEAKTFTQAQLDAYKDQIYASLSTEEKMVADTILNGEDIGTIDLSAYANYDKLVLITLYYFITT